MAKLLSTALLALLILVACSDPAPTAVVPLTATPHTEATPPSDSQPVLTKPANPTQEPTVVVTPQPTEIATTAPELTPAPGPTLIPEPTPTETPAPTATIAPTPTHMPTATPLPEATAAPTATSTPAPTQPPAQPSNLWRGITIAPENRCSPYDSAEYRYSPSVEPKIVDAQGGIYGPYTGTWFDSIKDTDIEHIVARSEAHDSGLCAASPDTRDRFASDLLNLTLASPSVNRHQKSDKDPSEWLPELNECWYVDRVVQVRQEYRLTIDRAEADAIERILAGCESTEMVVLAPGTSTTTTATPSPTAFATPTPISTPIPTTAAVVDALAMYDDNGNSRISCAEARTHGIAPVRRGHPAYEYMRDADGDGVVCE